MADINTDLMQLTEDLKPLQIRAIVMLAAGSTGYAVAEILDVSSRTIENWKADPKFKSYLRMALARMYEEAIAELILDSKILAQELKVIALDRNNPARIRVSAITAIFSAINVSKEWETDDRLTRLEAAEYDNDSN